MRFFLDTEFIENGPGQPIQLISIGIVAEDGRELYAVSREFNPDDADDWVKANVMPQIRLDTRTSIDAIRKYLVEFIGSEKPEFWGYYCDYDWVMFCQIFGRMVDLPTNWPMYCRDLKQWADQLGNPILPKQHTPRHHALTDAQWNKQVYNFLSSQNQNPVNDANAQLRMFIALRLLRAWNNGTAGYDELVVKVVHDWIDGGMGCPIPWPNDPWFAKWAKESGFSKVGDSIGFRFEATLNSAEQP